MIRCAALLSLLLLAPAGAEEASPEWAPAPETAAPAPAPGMRVHPFELQVPTFGTRPAGKRTGLAKLAGIGTFPLKGTLVTVRPKVGMDDGRPYLRGLDLKVRF